MAVISNLLDQQVHHINAWMMMFPNTCVAPFTLVLSFFYLVSTLGVSSIVFCVVYLFLIITISNLNERNHENQHSYLNINAEKISLIKEMTNNIKVIKLRSYEENM